MEWFESGRKPIKPLPKATMRGVINVIIGLVFIIGGLTGNLALRGTESGPALAAVGVLLVIVGGVRIARSRG
jgi:hypothetical protein